MYSYRKSQNVAYDTRDNKLAPSGKTIYVIHVSSHNGTESVNRARGEMDPWIEAVLVSCESQTIKLLDY